MQIGLYHHLNDGFKLSFDLNFKKINQKL